MKTKVDLDLLKGSLANITASIVGKSTNDGVYFKAEGNTLEIQRNNYECAASFSIPASVVSPGAVVVPKKIVDLIKKFNDPIVEIELKNNLLSVTAGNSQFQLIVSPADDFPVITKIPGTVTVDGPVLKNLIKKAVFASSTNQDNESRVAFTGVKIEYEDGILKLIATDAYRIAVAEAPVSTDLSSIVGAIVPAKFLERLIKLLGDLPVVISLTQGKMAFSTGSIYAETGLILANFPRHKDVIDRLAKSPSVVTGELDRKSFSDTLSRVAAIADKTNSVRFTFKDAAIEMFVENHELGKSRDLLKDQNFSGELEILFNPAFFDFLHVIDDDTFSVTLYGAKAAALIQAENFNYVVSPKLN